MGTLLEVSIRLHLALVAGLTGLVRRRDDRGDVPGWVLVTVMSAGLVIAIGAVAKDQLIELLKSALSSVK